MGFIIAIDQGTSSTGISIVTQEGKIIGQVNEPIKVTYPQEGWVEQDPEEIWNSVKNGLNKILNAKAILAREIIGIGITNQRETIVAWDKEDGTPLHKAIVWQCRRTAEHCAKISKNKTLSQKISNITGLGIDPYFSSTKMAWLLKNSRSVQASAEKNRLCFGTIDSYLNFRLTGEFKTDVTNASRTQLMDIKKLKWSPELLKIFGIPINTLPQIEKSRADFGLVKTIPNLEGIPVRAILGDQQAALFGQLCFSLGDAKCTLGTGSFLLKNIGTKPIPPKNGILCTLAWSIPSLPTVYALEASAFTCGSLMTWGAKILGAKDVAELLSWAQKVKHSEDVHFVPALSGLGTPYWKPNARAQWSGLNLSTTKEHLALSLVESVVLQNLDLITAMKKNSGHKMGVLKLDGGVTESSFLCQMHADILQQTVICDTSGDSTTMGVALMAGWGVFWNSYSELKDLKFKNEVYTPQGSSEAVQNLITKHQTQMKKQISK